MIFLGGGGLFSGELLGLFRCCWPPLLTFCGEGEEPSKQDRPDCSFLRSGDVLGKPGEVAQLLLPFCDISKDPLFLDACGLSSPGWTKVSVNVLPERGLAADKPELSHAAFLSTEAFGDCAEPTNLLAELTDARGRGIELLLESLL